MAATVAVNPALDAPVGTVTLAGRVTFELVEESATASPPLGAFPVKVTVHDEEPGALTLVGEQVSPSSVAGGGG
jgi:hypothetical protein